MELSDWINEEDQKEIHEKVTDIVNKIDFDNIDNIVILPSVKHSDTIYTIYSGLNDEPRVYEDIMNSYGFYIRDKKILIDTNYLYEAEYGKDWFLTSEEAEAKLKELKEKE